MTYKACLNECVSTAFADGLPGDATIYKNLPAPSDQDWAECLQEVADEESENLENAHDCMARWELRMHKLGFNTVLHEVVSRIESDLRDLASELGIPPEFQQDLITLAEFTALQKRM
jgi:hypothetical protein